MGTALEEGKGGELDAVGGGGGPPSKTRGGGTKVVSYSRDGLLEPLITFLLYIVLPLVVREISA